MKHAALRARTIEGLKKKLQPLSGIPRAVRGFGTIEQILEGRRRNAERLLGSRS